MTAAEIISASKNASLYVPQEDWDLEGLPSLAWHRAEMMNGSLEMAGEAAEDAEALLAEDSPIDAAERLKDAEAMYSEYLWFKSLSDAELQKHLEEWYGVEKGNGAVC